MRTLLVALLRILAVAAILCAAYAAAQAPAPAHPVTQATTKTPPAAPAVAPPAPVVVPPQLSEVERLRLANIELQINLLQRDYNDVVNQILRDHPGYRFDPRTDSLVPVPTPPAPPAEKK